MTDTIEARLVELDLTLPEPVAPVANYVPYLIDGPRLYISGQLPIGPGGMEFEGLVGTDLEVDEAHQAARLCALNILAQAKAALGDLERITQFIKLSGFVACGPKFTDHPPVVNGASNLMVEVLGERGRHTRLAVGVSSLPLNAAVEIEALFAIR